MHKQGKLLRSGEKQIVLNVRDFFEKEKGKGCSISRNRMIDRTSLATKVGKTTIKKLSKEFREKATVETPMKRYKASRIRINLDEFSTAAIRCAIHEFYTRKEYPTLNTVLKAVRDRGEVLLLKSCT